MLIAPRDEVDERLAQLAGTVNGYTCDHVRFPVTVDLGGLWGTCSGLLVWTRMSPKRRKRPFAKGS